MPARGKRKKGDDNEPGVPAWVVTYGDMMSLLLTFFVLLLSFSTISEEAFNRAMMSLQGAFGVLPQFTHIINPVARPQRKVPREIEGLAREIQRQAQVDGREQDVEVKYDKDGGLKIVLPNKVLFDSAKADLKAGCFEVLQGVGELLADLDTAVIEVRGHTDDRPLRGSSLFRDNWDLSFSRADAVVRYLGESAKVAMNRFEIIACGPSQPIATNATPEGQAKNRRVEIYVRGLPDSSKIDEMEARFDGLVVLEEGSPEVE